MLASVSAIPPGHSLCVVPRTLPLASASAPVTLPTLSTLGYSGLYPRQLQLPRQVTFGVESPGTTPASTYFSFSCPAKVASAHRIPGQSGLFHFSFSCLNRVPAVWKSPGPSATGPASQQKSLSTHSLHKGMTIHKTHLSSLGEVAVSPSTETNTESQTKWEDRGIYSKRKNKTKPQEKN